MLTTKLLMSGLVAFGLALAPTGVIAAEPHGHAATAKISLDHGKKWPTDEALRRGMGEIRNAMADALPAIHRDKFSSGEFEKLAGRVQGQIDYVTANSAPPMHQPPTAEMIGLVVSKPTVGMQRHSSGKLPVSAPAENASLPAPVSTAAFCVGERSKS